MELNIIHIDMDAFYAAIEQRDNPKLKGKPVIIGGTSGRGVVSTASYEAREYGIHSAMPMAQARKLCPDGIYIRPRHGLYKEVSAQIREVFYNYTNLVEPLALDEAYLDVTEHWKNSLQIAKEIKRKIKEKVNLVASVGVSYNKYLAKLASDFNKPNGFKIISPFQAQEIIFPLEVRHLWGVGPKTEEKLKELGLETIADVAQTEQKLLINKLGKRGYQLYKLAHGEDNREVNPPGIPKSIGKETTFRQDIASKSTLRQHLRSLSAQVANRVASKDLAGKTVTLKIKYEDFEVLSRSKTITDYIKTEDQIYSLADKLLTAIDLVKEVRLIGVTLSNIKQSNFEQLQLFKSRD